MTQSKMTVRQLCAAVALTGPVFLVCSWDWESERVKLTSTLRGIEGIMSLEVYHLKHNTEGYIAAVAMPPEIIKAFADYGKNN